MHECPECGEVCDCDGEDLWYDDDMQTYINCIHVCDYGEDDEVNDGNE